MEKKGEKLKKMFVRIIVDYMKKCARATPVNMVKAGKNLTDCHIEMKSLASAGLEVWDAAACRRERFSPGFIQTCT